MRISSIARLLGDRPNGRLSPVRCLALTAAAPSGNFTRFTILSAALDERRNTRHNLLVMHIIRTPYRFVNGILSGQEKACGPKKKPDQRPGFFFTGMQEQREKIRKKENNQVIIRKPAGLLFGNGAVQQTHHHGNEANQHADTPNGAFRGDGAHQHGTYNSKDSANGGNDHSGILFHHTSSLSCSIHYGNDGRSLAPYFPFVWG